MKMHKAKLYYNRNDSHLYTSWSPRSGRVFKVLAFTVSSERPIPWFVGTVEEDCLLGDEPVCAPHFLEHARHPVFNPTFSSNVVSEIHRFTLGRHHGSGQHLIVGAFLES